ncbi:MAG: TadE/TadG family type IV pilus assembly protein [Candidatus Binataceae bacterium]
MNRAPRRIHRTGQTAVEFAIVVSIFSLMIFAVFMLGLAAYSYNMVCAASREAARYAMVHGPASANPANNARIAQVAIDYAPGLALTAADVSVTWPADPNQPSTDDAKVVVTYQYRVEIPFITPVTLTLSSSSRMMVSQ